MGYGPVPDTESATESGLTLEQMELIELNEAFAAQYLACEQLLELNREIVNVNGSGIALAIRWLYRCPDRGIAVRRDGASRFKDGAGFTLCGRGMGWP